MAWVALVYAGGLVLAEWLQPPVAILCAISLCFAIGAIVWAAGRSWLLWPLLLTAGWTSFLCHTAILSPFDLRVLQRDLTTISTIRGRLLQTPDQRVRTIDDKEISRSMAQVEVTHLLQDGTNWQRAFGRVLVLAQGKLPHDFFQGQEVEITGVLSSPPGPRAEGLFDYRAYLRRQNIHYQLKTDSPEDWQLRSENREPPWSDRFTSWAQTILARGLPTEDESLHLLWAMTLGWKTGLTNEIYEPFMQSGTMHIFAISGLHIAFIAGILVQLLRVLRIPRSWCGGIVIPLIWLYTAATGWQPSAIRSTIMMTVIIGGWMLKRPTDLLNSLATAAFLILLWDPQQLFGASFQLSFFVVLSIGLLLPPLERWRDQLLQTDPLLPADLVPPWQQWLRAGARCISNSLAISLAAWLGALPLTIYYFHLFSPVTLLANIVVVPLSSLALACNLGSLVCGAWLPWVTELFNHSAWFWMSCMMKLSQWCASLPAAFFYLPDPSLATICSYYSVLVMIFAGWLWKAEKRPWAVAGMLLLASSTGWDWMKSQYSLEMSVLPLNGGFSVYVRGGGPGTLLVDTGTTNLVRSSTKPFLRAHGVNRVDNLVLTHGDLRHIGGAELVTQDFKVRRVCASSIRFRSGAYSRILERLKQTPGLVRTVGRNDRIGGWDVLHPEPQDRYARADDNSLVLYGCFGSIRVLLLSDLGRLGQEALIERSRGLRADIVVTGIPAGSEAVCDALLDVVQPQVVIVADAAYPIWERTNPKCRERLSRKHIPVLYLSEAGAISVKVKDNRWEATTVSRLSLAGGAKVELERAE